MNKTIGSERYRRLIAWLKDARIKRGDSMRELGERIGEPHSFVQKIETLERRLDVYEYVQYCEALDLNPKIGLQFLERQ